MKLDSLVKIALDELRMQMLGAQVLFGFGLQGVFQEQFAEASQRVHDIYFVALCLIVGTIGLLLAGPSQHRLVDRGAATTRIFKVATHFSEASLLPLGASLGCYIYVVTEPYWGSAMAIAGSIAAASIALTLWYAAGFIIGTTVGDKEIPPMPPQIDTDCHAKIDQMLTESRVILPGAQALLGFQLVVTMTNAFATMESADKAVHFFALAFVALSVMLLITPAAVHRLAFGGRDVPRFHTIGSFLVTTALVPLAMGISTDFFVAATKIFGNHRVAALSASVVFLMLAFLWYGLPLILREFTPRPSKAAPNRLH